MALPPTWTLFGEHHLPHRLQLLARMIEREAARQLAEEAGISLAEWRVLVFVGTKARASAADVCIAFDVDRAEVSRAVARLTGAGLLARQQDDENRKRLLLELTDAGLALYRRMRDRRVDYFRSILSDLQPRERELLDDLLLRLATKVDKLRED